MRIKLIEKLGGRVHEIEAVLLIVEDKFGNPIQLACELQPGIYNLANIDQGEAFRRSLRMLGVDKLVLTDTIAAEPPPQGSKVLFSP
jgi:hypothetical protein